MCFRCSGKLQRSAVHAGGGLVAGSRTKGGDGDGDSDEVNMDTDGRTDGRGKYGYGR